jgi:hypothetical protein
MDMENTEEIATVPQRLQIWHKDYNLDHRDNIPEIPAQKAVFGIFAIIGEEQANCRFIGQAEDLSQCIKALFEGPDDKGLKSFMQGSWVKSLEYQVFEMSSPDQRSAVVDEWARKYRPGIHEDGGYPGYYD